jgi:hypothetical protein
MRAFTSLHYMHGAAPSGEAVTVDARQQALRHRLEQILGLLRDDKRRKLNVRSLTVSGKSLSPSILCYVCDPVHCQVHHVALCCKLLLSVPKATKRSPSAPFLFLSFPFLSVRDPTTMLAVATAHQSQ